ncbi:MAG: iron complex outermembrane receptor protein [Polaribacter sp.]|jgi:iron complex outermembrane receptor protein
MNKEIANKFIISLERNNDNFGFIISPYLKQIEDFMQLIPVGITTTIRGAFPVWEYQQVNAQIFGVDIDLNKKISSKFDYQGSISLLKGTNLTDNIPLIHMPSANFRNQITYKDDRLHQLSISLKHKTVLQQNQFPDYNFNTFNAILQEEVFVDISTTPPSYSLFDLTTSAVFKAFKKGNLKLEFNIENLFNVAYRENLNRLRYFADELGRNFNLKIKINY